MEEEEQDLEFRPVEQGKEENVPPVIVKIFEGGNFFKLPLPKLRKLVDEIKTIGGFINARKARGGNLFVYLKSMDAVESLLKMNKLGNLPVRTSLPNNISDSVGVISWIPLHYGDDEILEELKNFGVIQVKRIQK